jgi:hypothetical protein
MRTKFFAGLFLVAAVAANAFGAVILEKRSRELPFVEVFDCHGVHSFIFRGPTGTSRHPILVPPREYWTGQPAGLYKFVLRYEGGRVCSRLVTPAVYARYSVGQEYYDRTLSDSERYETEDSKTVQPTMHHRRSDTASLRKKKHSSHRALAKHRHRRHTRMIAQR